MSDLPMSDSAHRRRVLTIPSDAPFLETLADALMSGALFGETQNPANPLALAQATILLPTQRACREFRAALLRHAGGGPLLLPRIEALGLLDEAAHAVSEEAASEEAAGEDGAVPDYPRDDAASAMRPAMGAMERQFVLTRAIHTWGRTMAADILELAAGEAPVIPGSPAHAAYLAADLARLMDQMETEEIDLAALGRLDVEEHARFWQITLQFMTIMTESWPDILAERGLMAPMARRNALIDAEAARLARLRPETPIIAAGSTGTVPATARLLGVIASLPRGAVILPGLDANADDEAWKAIAGQDAASHPQHGMARLLGAMGVERSEVRPLGKARVPARLSLINQAMRPAEQTAHWHEAAASLGANAEQALDGLCYVEAATPLEEAVAIALMLREAAEDGTGTAALVTPDRMLARRVEAELARWDIMVDDSAGTPLAATAMGMLARHAAEIMSAGLRPVPLLAMLKHPLCTLGLAPGAARHGARMLELAVFRGTRPEPSFAGIRKALAAVQASTPRYHAAASLTRADWEAGDDVLARLERALAPLAQLHDASQPVEELLSAHLAVLQALTALPDGSAPACWSADDGRALVTFFNEALHGAKGALSIQPGDYPALFSALAAGRPVRSGRQTRPRLHILGLLEARLLHFDRIILGGLNEGTWPAEPGTDPWLSRSLRARLGMERPERRIGLASHDFVQAFGAREVILTRSRTSDGAPSVPSRWLLRLEALLRAAGQEALLRNGAERWLAMARALDRPDAFASMPPPRPVPQVAHRPRRLSVTQVETWLRDPYAIYARHILKLSPLDPLDAPFDARERGTIIHEAMKDFIAGTGGVMDEDALARLLAIGAALFDAIPDAPEVRAFWMRRFARAARWFITFQRALHQPGTRIFTEVSGALSVDAPAGPFTVTARADRIDCLADGGAMIFDYKTGAPPAKNELAKGLAPQLPLEAAIAAGGGFAGAGLEAASITGLAFLQIGGGTPPGVHTPVDADIIEALHSQAIEGLKRRAAIFDQAATPYLSRPYPKFASRFAGDYDHLARIKEWSRDAAGES